MGDLISALLTYSRLNDPRSSELLPVSSLTAYENAVANLRAAIAERKRESRALTFPTSYPMQRSFFRSFRI
jgi:hypothetical protein